MKKITLLLGTLTIASSVAVVTPLNTKASQPEFNIILDKDKEAIINSIRNNIISNSHNEMIIQQINKNSKKTIDEVVKESLQSNPIIQKQTSSNPSQIIKDYEYETLDENQIYDTHESQFVKAYSDAFGNVERSRERAAKSYINAGNVRIKYSYDGVRWADSEGEAKAIQKRPSKIKKSLYYSYDNKYYNAFNKAETDKLQNYLINKGISNKSKDSYHYYLEYKGLNNKVHTLTGNEENIKKSLKNKLKDEIFYGNNQLDFFEKIIPQDTLEFAKVIEFNSNKTYKFNSKYNDRVKDNGTKYVFLIKPNHPFYEKSLSWIKDIFQKEKNFGKKIIKEKVCSFLNASCESYEYYWVDSKKGDNLLYKLIEDDKFEIVHDERRAGMFDDAKKIDLENIEVIVAGHAKFEISDKNLGAFNVILPPIDPDINNNRNKLEKFNPKYVSDLSQHFPEIFDSWYDALFLKLMDKFKNGTLGSIEYNLQPSVHDLSYIKDLGMVQIKLDYTDDTKNNNLATMQENIASKHSFDKIKNQGPQLSNGKALWKNVEISEKVYENYVELCSANGSGQCNIRGLDLRVMYHYMDDEHASVYDNGIDRSDLLFIREKDAEENMLVTSKSSYFRKKYIVYDIFGEVASEGYSEQDVLKRALTNVYIPYRFIHISELNNYPNRKYYDLVSSGTYMVYGVLFNDKYIYFKSYEKALAAYKKQFIKWDDFFASTKTINTYKYYDGKEYHTYKYENKDELENIVDEIYDKFYARKGLN